MAAATAPHAPRRHPISKRLSVDGRVCARMADNKTVVPWTLCFGTMCGCGMGYVKKEGGAPPTATEMER